MGEKDLGHSRPLTEEILIAVTPASSYQPPVELADIPLEIEPSGNILSPPVTRPRVVEVQIEPTSRHGVVFEYIANTLSALPRAIKGANRDFEHRFVAALLRADRDKQITLIPSDETAAPPTQDEEGDGIITTPDRKRKLREIAAPIIRWVAEKLHERGVSADDATSASVIGVAAGLSLIMLSNWEKLSPKWRKILKGSGGVITILSEALDAVDGAIKRLSQQREKERKKTALPGTTLEQLNLPIVKHIEPDYGDVNDAVADRTQETLSTLLRMYLAADIEGMRLALFSALSNTLPSIARALAVSRRVSLDESGMGTRVERAVYQIVGVLFHRVGRIPVQKIIDAFNLSANIVRFIDRMIQVANGPKPGKRPKEKPEVGARRMYYLLLTQVLITIISLSAYEILSSRMSKEE